MRVIIVVVQGENKILGKLPTYIWEIHLQITSSLYFSEFPLYILSCLSAVGIQQHLLYYFHTKKHWMGSFLKVHMLQIMSHPTESYMFDLFYEVNKEQPARRLGAFLALFKQA